VHFVTNASLKHAVPQLLKLAYGTQADLYAQVAGFRQQPPAPLCVFMAQVKPAKQETGKLGSAFTNPQVVPPYCLFSSSSLLGAAVIDKTA